MFAGGQFYYATITLPGTSTQAWYPAIPYYFTPLNSKPKYRMDLITLKRSVSSNIDTAFTQLIKDVNDDQLCPGCNNSKLNSHTLMYIMGIQNIQNVR